MAGYDALSDFVNQEADYNFTSGLELLKRGAGSIGSDLKRGAELLTHAPSFVEAIKQMPDYIMGREVPGIDPSQVPTFEDRVVGGMQEFAKKGRENSEQVAMDFMPGGMGITAQQLTQGVGKGWLGSLRAAINRTANMKGPFGPPNEAGVRQMVESLLVNEGSGIIKNYSSLRRLEDSLQRSGVGESVFAPVMKASGSIISPRNPTWHGAHYPYSGEIALFSNPIAKAYTDLPTMKAANTALHEGIHAKQISDQTFLEGLKEIEPAAKKWRQSNRFPGGTSYAHVDYMADPIEMMARGVSHNTLQKLYPSATPKDLYGPGTWYPSDSWPKELNPIWDNLSNILLGR